MTDLKPIREHILKTAVDLTCGDRNASYGDPLDNHKDIAALWSAYLDGYPMTPKDVAIMMALVKIARSKMPKPHRDNYIDAAAYLAIAGEIHERTTGADAPERTHK